MTFRFNIEIEAERHTSDFPLWKYRAKLGDVVGIWRFTPEMAVASLMALTAAQIPDPVELMGLRDGEVEAYLRERNQWLNVEAPCSVSSE